VRKLKTRAQALRTGAEHPTLLSAESNRAFVLMQYFGFLRRNPDDAPDTDYAGCEFWLTKLNQFNGNFQDAEMVTSLHQLPGVSPEVWGELNSSGRPFVAAPSYQSN